MMRVLATVLAALMALPVAAPAQEAYRIQAGDVLRVEVLEDATLNRSVLVPPDGRISIPLAGVVQAGGRSVEQIQANLASALAPNFAAPPNVFVSIERIAPADAPLAAGPVEPETLTIYVMGEAANPGKLAVEPGTTLLQLFAEMGGFTNFAATKRIQLRRTDPATGAEQVYSFSYDAIERGTSTAGNTVVAEGDVILVPQRRLFE